MDGTSKTARAFTALTTAAPPGGTWQERDTRISNGQGNYSSGVFVDSQNPDILYTMSTAMYHSTDGGVTFEPFKKAPGGEDYHKLWIDPTNGKRMLVGSDQDASVTLDNGKTWSLWYTETISQVYHVATDDQYPYRIMAGQQDTGAVMISSRGNWGEVNFTDWNPVPSSEFGIVRPDPKNPNIIYGVGYDPGGGGSGLIKINMATGQWQNVAPNGLSSATTERVSFARQPTPGSRRQRVQLSACSALEWERFMLTLHNKGGGLMEWSVPLNCGASRRFRT